MRALVAIALLAACTIRVEVAIRPAPVALAPADAAVAVTPPASPWLVGDAGPCGLLTLSGGGGSNDPCAAATHYIDADVGVIPLTENCQRFGDNTLECW